MDWLHSLLPLHSAWDDVVDPSGTTKFNVLAQRNDELYMIARDSNGDFVLGLLHLEKLVKPWISEKLKSNNIENLEEILSTPCIKMSIPFNQQDAPKYLSLNPQKTLLAIISNHKIVVVTLADATKTRQVLTLKQQTVGSFWHETDERNDITSVQWWRNTGHFSSPDGTHLCVLSSDGMWRLYDLNKTNRDPILSIRLTPPPTQQLLLKTREKPMIQTVKPSASLLRSRAVGFTFGSDSDPWSALTLYGMTGEGDVYSICPIIPGGKFVVDATLLSALALHIKEEIKSLSSKKSKDFPTEHAQLGLQLKLVDWLLHLCHVATDQPNQSTTIFIPYIKSNQDDVDSTSIPEQISCPMRVGPWFIKPEPPIGPGDGMATDLIRGGKAGNLGYWILIAWRDKVDVLLEPMHGNPKFDLIKVAKSFQKAPKRIGFSGIYDVEDELAESLDQLMLGSLEDYEEGDEVELSNQEPDSSCSFYWIDSVDLGIVKEKWKQGQDPHFIPGNPAHLLTNVGLQTVDTRDLTASVEEWCNTTDVTMWKKALDLWKDNKPGLKVTWLVQAPREPIGGVIGFALLDSPSLGNAWIAVTANKDVFAEEIVLPIKLSQITPIEPSPYEYNPPLPHPWQPPTILSSTLPRFSSKVTGGDTEVLKWFGDGIKRLREHLGQVWQTGEQVEERAEIVKQGHAKFAEAAKELNQRCTTLQQQVENTKQRSQILDQQGQDMLLRVNAMVQIMLDVVKPDLSQEEKEWSRELQLLEARIHGELQGQVSRLSKQIGMMEKDDRSLNLENWDQGQVGRIKDALDAQHKMLLGLMKLVELKKREVDRLKMLQ